MSSRPRCNVPGCSNHRGQGGMKCDMHYKEHLAANPPRPKCISCGIRDQERDEECWQCLDVRLKLEEARKEQEEYEQMVTDIKELEEKVAALEEKDREFDRRLSSLEARVAFPLEKREKYGVP